ncbi:MAG TPA: tetratricopeptide repeat protein [Balneolales bacterium]|nr:tetratricopeptide repeat protein [Balneolales bacterium]
MSQNRIRWIYRCIGIAVCLIGILLSYTSEAQAQIGQQYQLADQFMQEGKYEKAYNILSDLLEKFPNSYPVYDHAITCLIHLKKYNQAISITKKHLGKNYKNVVMAVRLGKIYHMAGDTARAFKVWHQTLQQNDKQVQTYRYLAETMQQSREYDEATRIYKTARKRFNNPQLFLYEMAVNYLQAGKNEEAIDEFLHLIKTDNSRLEFVEQQLRRYNDEYIYNSAIQATENADQRFSTDKSYQISLKRLLVWLYLQTGKDRLALNTAKKLEAMVKSGNYPVFDVAEKLKSNNKFKLASEAFSYYSQKQNHPLTARSLEEDARLDIRWAQYLNDYNIDFSNRIDSLYHQAFQTIHHITQHYPGYQRMPQILTLEAELALNHIKDLKAAQKYVAQLQNTPQNKNSQKLVNYLKGRILLTEGNFNRARIYLTRSNKAAHSGPLADKTRYYLSLTDFYAGDYDFANIQIRTLEKVHTSLYANDALQLRIWIQDGKNRDSTYTELNSFAKAQFLVAQGQVNQALDTLYKYVLVPSYHPLKDDMVLYSVKLLRDEHPLTAFLVADKYLENEYYRGPLKERLLWERAQLASRIHSNKSLQKKLLKSDYKPELPEYILQKKRDFFNDKVKKRLISTTREGKDVISLYEQIIIHYPRGFYAEFARNQIRQIQQEDQAS